MRLIIRLIDRAAQGLSKTPLFVFIGRLGEKISADNGNMAWCIIDLMSDLNLMRQRCPSQKVGSHHHSRPSASATKTDT
eukprot:scaffold2730_cov76-Skeletonema_dohrnii-CCMP3373.AAC.4